jgi:pimeloyl-ACP methyl ester carboxylesterase
MNFFDADGTVLHHARAGQGRPLVFVNSLGSDFRIWDDVLPALTPRAKVIRYDKRGHGLSDLGPISMEGHVADLAALLDGLATGPAVVCGLSVGGQIALGLSAARPDLVRGLILMDTGHRIGTPEIWDERIATIESGGIAAAAEATLARWFTPEFHATRPADLAGARRRAVLGDAHVDRAEAAKTDFDAPFQDLITEGPPGARSGRRRDQPRERSMLTLALLAATGNFEEIPMHVRATANTGASPEDVMEAFLHVAIYAGRAARQHAIKLAKQTLPRWRKAEMTDNVFAP